MNFKFILLPALLAAWTATARSGLQIFAAASTTDVLQELAAASGAQKVHFNFAGTGTLARQIAAGAPADLFISANRTWVQWLEQQETIQLGTRINLATNTLVLIEPRTPAARLPPPTLLKHDVPFPAGRIAVGDLHGVPAGIYAREALEHMGRLETLRPRLVMAASVRTALLYVERGELNAAIVYATDARQSKNVKVTGIFPAESHSPLVYTAVACSNHPDAATFLTFLQSHKAATIFKKHGFK